MNVKSHLSDKLNSLALWPVLDALCVQLFTRPGASIESEKSMKERTMTVGDSTAGYGTEIRLRGIWLKEAGFTTGTRAILTVKADGVIEIRKPEASKAQETFEIVAMRLDHAIAAHDLDCQARRNAP